MPAEYNRMYEAYCTTVNHDFLEYVIPYAHGTKFYGYEVDFQAMTQTNKTTGKVRRIRRLTVAAPFDWIALVDWAQ